MNWFQKASIRRKQTLIIMLTSSVVLLLACAAFSVYEAMAFRHTMKQNLATLADIVDHNSTAALDFNDSKSAEETLSALQADPAIIGAWLYKGGEAFAKYDRPNDNIIFTPPAILPNGTIFQGQRLIVCRPVMLKGEMVGTLYLESDMQALHARLTRYALIAGLVFVVAWLIAFALSSQLQRLVSDPILQLAQVARSVALEKNYSVRAVKRSGDELGQLIDGFNEMLAQIQERDAALQAARDHLEHRVEERTVELAQSLSLLNATLDSTADGILAQNLSGQITLHNTKFAAIWGFPKEVLDRRQTDELVTNVCQQIKDPEKLVQRIKEAQSNPEAEVFDVFESKDGRTFERYSIPQRMGSKCAGVVVSWRDVTKRRRTEEALRDSQALYHSLVEQLPVGIFRKDKEGRFVFVNSWFCRLKGVTAGQFLGKTPEEIAAGELAALELRNPEERSETELAIQGTRHHEQIMQTGRQIQLEEQSPGAEGKSQFFHVVKSPVFDPDGKIIGSQGILMDITERKQAENALHASNEKFQQLVDNITDVFWIRSPDLREVHYVSPAFERIWGRSVESLYANPQQWAEFILPEDRERVLAAFAALAEDATSLNLEYRIVRPEGEVRWVCVRGFQVRDAADKLSRHIGIVTDITDRKRSESELEKVHQQLLETSRQAGMAEVATSVLHNVGNVLNSVNVSSTCVADNLRKSKAVNLSKVVALLREHETDLAAFLSGDSKGRQIPGYLAQLAGHLAAEQNAALKELAGLQKNIEHIKDIVAMQQSYAKVSGVTETLQISDLVEDALHMNASALTRHEVQVVREYAEVPPVTIEKHKVLQVLVNLIRNAKYACDESGRSDKRMTMRVTNGGNRVRISISDNGVGIPAENLIRIFNYGFTTRKDGHGFGLHSGALAARELGGSLNVHSEGPGQGAVFTLELPIKQESSTKWNAA